MCQAHAQAQRCSILHGRGWTESPPTWHAPPPSPTGNFAGPVGAATAYLLGLYDDQPEAAAVCGSSIWDIVPGAPRALRGGNLRPGDATAHARAAVVALHDAAAHCEAPPLAPSGAHAESPPPTLSFPPGDTVAHATIAAAAAAACPASRAYISTGSGRAPATAAAAGTETGSLWGSAAAVGGPLIVQVATSCTYPVAAYKIFNDVSGERWGYGALTCWLPATQPAGSGARASFGCRRPPPAACPSADMARVWGARPWPPESGQHCAPRRTCTTPPNRQMVLFCAAHRRTFTLARGPVRGMDPHKQLDHTAWARHMRAARRRVGAIAWLLGCGAQGSFLACWQATRWCSVVMEPGCCPWPRV